MTINKINTPLTDNATAGKINEIINDYASKNLDNLSPYGYALLNDSKALESGTVGCDPEVYEDIYKYVHSSSETGTDIYIKNGSVVGTPAFDSGSILTVSSCNSSNYVKLPAGFITEDGWSLYIPFPTGAWTDTVDLLTIPSTGSVPALKIMLGTNNDNQFSSITWSLSHDGSTYMMQETIDLSSIVLVDFERTGNALIHISFSGSSYGLEALVNNTYYEFDSYISSDRLSGSSSSEICICNSESTSAGTGYINLDDITFVFNSSVVFSGTSDIVVLPYTKSKTGSKIVSDGSYYKKIQALYNLQGYAPYYMINEGETYNFTFTSNVTLSNGVASGFARQGGMVLYTFPSASSLDIFIKGVYTSGGNVTQRQYLFNCRLGSSSGSSLNMATGGTTGSQLRLDCNGVSNIADIVTLNDNDTIEAHIRVTSSKLETWVKINGGVEIYRYSQGSPGDILLPETFQIGSSYSASTTFNSNWKGSIDLASTRLVINDESIIYAYLSHCYSLPMGEVYGMMNKTVDSKIQSFSNSTVTHTADTAVGSATQPVYVASDGTATVTTYSLAKSVPSDAVFTDTTYSAGTGLSLSGTTFNHSNSVTAGTAGTSSATSGASLDVPYITYDAQGHITATGTHTHTITGFLTQSDVTSTYTSSGTAPVNGQAVNSAISTAISSVYKPAGSVAFANLPTLSSSVLGNVYDLTDSFTTDSRFVEGTGNTYPAGTNVVVVDVSTTSTPDYKFDVLAGFVDLSGYQLANTAVTHTASTAAGSATQPVYVNSSGVATATTYELNKTVPSDAVFTDTLNTAGSTDTSSQIYLIGATEQAANPQTYSHDTVYVDTNGRLHASSPATSANDTSLATTYWVTGKGYATDSAVVHLADTETITGNKTFSGTVTLGASATATTPASTDNSTSVATTAYVKSQNYVAVTIRNWD